MALSIPSKGKDLLVRYCITPYCIYIQYYIIHSDKYSIVICILFFVGPSDSKLESDAHHTLVLGDGDYIEVENTGSEKLHFVLIAGQPLNESVVQHGKLGVPHVNTV